MKKEKDIQKQDENNPHLEIIIKNKVNDMDDFLEEHLKWVENHNTKLYSIREAINNKDIIKFENQFNIYIQDILSRNENLTKKEKEGKTRLLCIEWFLDALNDKKLNIPNAINFIHTKEMMHKKNIALCLWIKQKEEIKNYVLNEVINIDSTYYDNFYDVFKKHIERDDLPLGMMQKNTYFKNEKDMFFNEYLKISFQTKLKKELSQSPKVVSKKMKI